MGKIRVLSDNIANKIAAGEVVERPFSVVKELVENSIDAESTDILIEVKNGGKDLIRIIDNGIGMSYDDALLSLERHSTSKIASVRDLESINTFGFRGEALPSIASVSIMEMITQQRDELEGTKIRVEGGIIKDVTRIGSAVGTRITVSNLFYNVPARKKFLKSSATELDHIIKYISWASLAYPNISFKLISNDKVLIEARRCGSILERIYTLYGKDFADNIVEIDQEFETTRINAFIGKPGWTRTTRDYQMFFLNKRPIRSNLLNSAVGAIFKTILPKGRYPVVIMFIEVNPSDVDVNVHPAKWEVRFRDERTVYSDVTHCLLLAIQGQGYIPSIDISTSNIPLSEVEKIGLETELGTNSSPRERQVESSVSRYLNSQRVSQPNISHQYIHREGKKTEKQSYNQDISDLIERQIIRQEKEISSETIGNINIKSRLFDTYIVAEMEDEVIFIDQHIADERVIYEKLRGQMQKESIPSQGLLLPITVELSLSQSELLDTIIDMLKDIGFELEPFGGRTIIVRSIPSIIQKGDIRQIVSDIIDQISNSFGKIDRLELQDEILIITACRSAIQSGDPLTDAEVKNLVKELFKTEQPYLCPHGRPIIVKINKSELDQKFQRK
ncbi:MAG: DNA mismatch repair endonuclease MutL [Candidatus Poribacteria bacterium]